MKNTLAAVAGAALLQQAAAFPHAALEAMNEAVGSMSVEKRQFPGAKPGFNAEYQYVSTSGVHAFVAPGPTDQRGPCPGLNAMANHGYLAHNGVGNVADFTQGCFEAFGMGLDLGGFLGVYGSIFNGNLDSWSIGGPTAAVPSVAGLLGTPQGISGSHNNYENDASPIRGDLYLYGNDYLNQVSLFQDFIDKQAGVPEDETNYDLTIINAFRAERFADSESTNPYFWNGPFSGIVASPAAYSFIYRFMANKSAEYPEGRLDRAILQDFYSMTGESGSYKYTPGYERFPENWYKRAFGDEYTIPYFFFDAAKQIAEHPQFASLGGNLGKTNSFVGIDPANLTGGIYDLQMLSQGNNLQCFGFELLLQAAPSSLEGLFLDVTPAMNALSSEVAKANNGLGCPSLASLQYNQFGFSQYPGYSKSYDGYKGMTN